MRPYSLRDFVIDCALMVCAVACFILTAFLCAFL